jgi:hypothetical protein
MTEKTREQGWNREYRVCVHLPFAPFFLSFALLYAAAIIFKSIKLVVSNGDPYRKAGQRTTYGRGCTSQLRVGESGAPPLCDKRAKAADVIERDRRCVMQLTLGLSL